MMQARIQASKGDITKFNADAIINAANTSLPNHVIHTIGPDWNGGMSGEAELLANAYRNSLRIVTELCIKTIAFPNFSTGIYKFPKDKAASIAVSTIRQFLETNDTIDRVTFVCFDEENYQIYQRLLSEP